jgi:hypothetical protein
VSQIVKVIWSPWLRPCGPDLDLLNQISGSIAAVVVEARHDAVGRFKV